MAFCRSVFVLLVLNVVLSYASVPVFIWGDLDGKAPKSNPLTTITEPEFQGILKRELRGESFVAVFSDESLSVEDFSLKNENGDTVFPYLHANIGDAVYIPSADSPLETLHELAEARKATFIKVTDNGLSAEIEPKDDDVVFITLKDAQDGESRADLLRRHNDFMEDMFTKLQAKYDKVVAVYTARFPSWIVPEAHSRVRRQADATNDYNLNGLRLYVSKLVLTVNGKATNLVGLSTSTTAFNETSMSTSMVFGDNTVILNFAQLSGYWRLDSVTLKTNTETVDMYGSDLYALVGFSYRCAHNVVYSTVGTDYMSLLFQDIKVQPFFKETNGTVAFGDSFNCVGFFTVPIWSGLFVTFVLLAITFYGIMMMMDIRTMDRFDDPKGKTITINAGE